RYDILLRHLNKVVELAKKYGLKPRMWSDMFFRIATDDYCPAEIPESVTKLVPEEIGLEYWDYYRKDKKFYDDMFKSHKAFNREISYAGGAWCWHGFAPLVGQSLKTMKLAMQSVAEHGIENVMITMWGDGGHECSFYTLLHVLYAIRQYANLNFDEDEIKRGFNDITGLNFDDFNLLELPNLFDFDKEMGEPHNPCRTLLYNDIFLGYFDKNLSENPSIKYAEYAKVIDGAKARAGEYGYLFDRMAKLCSTLSLKSELGLKLRSAYKKGDRKTLKELNEQIPEIIKRLKEFHKAYFYEWHLENKPYGFEVQDARLGGLMNRLQSCHNRLTEYLGGVIDEIPELTEEILPFKDGKSLRHYSYAMMVSLSNMAK
ncbi:MAG: hypothetical protein IJV99_04125, partial [Clostridia bacterium]|nr:hypothetical protein [Clostridia bacterium]